MNSTTPILSLTQPQRATLSWDGFINGDLGILDSYAGSVSSSISSLSGSIAGLSAFTLNGTTGSVSLVAGNNITLSQALSQITISAGSFSQSVQTQGSVLVNGSSGSIVFTAGTNITLSQNASTITIIGASGGSQSVQTQSTVAINGSTGSIVLTAGNNITLSQNASTITISAANQSIQTQSTVAVNGSTGQISHGRREQYLSVPECLDHYHLGIQCPGSNNQTISVYASSQTVGQSSSSTLDARSFTHVGQGIVSVGLSAGSLLISATTTSPPDPELRRHHSQGPTAGVLTLISSGTLFLAGGNNIVLSQNGQSVTISGPMLCPDRDIRHYCIQYHLHQRHPVLLNCQ